MEGVRAARAWIMTAKNKQKGIGWESYTLMHKSVEVADIVIDAATATISSFDKVFLKNTCRSFYPLRSGDIFCCAKAIC